VLDTKEYGLKVEPKIEEFDKSWTITVFSDSDYAGDNDTRISMTGFCIFLLGVPIVWKSKSQKSVTLSSSKAEFVALSEAVKEIKFVVQVLESIGVKVKFPIIVRVDNVGAIFMAENVTNSQRTKHVDIRYHFVREFVVDGYIKIIFVKTEENRADMFTKNVSGGRYQEHAGNLLRLETRWEFETQSPQKCRNRKGVGISRWRPLLYVLGPRSCLLG